MIGIFCVMISWKFECMFMCICLCAWVCASKLTCFPLFEYPLRQAAELLRHPYLEPYVFKIHLKINSPRHNALPVQWPESNYIKKTRFADAEELSLKSYRKKRHSFSNDRALNPNISVGEQDSFCSTKGIHGRLSELSIGSSNEGTVICKSITVSKPSNIAKASKLTPTKASVTTRRRTEPVKKRESVR